MLHKFGESSLSEVERASTYSLRAVINVHHMLVRLQHMTNIRFSASVLKSLAAGDVDELVEPVIPQAILFSFRSALDLMIDNEGPGGSGLACQAHERVASGRRDSVVIAGTPKRPFTRQNIHRHRLPACMPALRVPLGVSFLHIVLGIDR